MKIKKVLSNRDDISRFVIHLTRDTKNGMSAKDNLLSILEDKEIKAFNHHCLFSPALNQTDDKVQNKFNTVCFTETPLDKISHLFNIDGRKVDLKPYGLVFEKEEFINKGGNPCIYTNGKGNKSLESYLWFLFNNSKANEFKDEFYKLGSIVNTMKENHDFSWEREWRISENFEVDQINIFAIISDDKDIDLPVRYTGIPIINPEWNFEDIVFNLSWQLRNDTDWHPLV